MNFQGKVHLWMMKCFGSMASGDKTERGFRFLEESLELVQATGTTAEEAHVLVDYVFCRPIGERDQEVGGVMVTLAALCTAHDMDMDQEGERELMRIWDNIYKIRAKQAAKPKNIRTPIP